MSLDEDEDVKLTFPGNCSYSSRSGDLGIFLAKASEINNIVKC